MSKVSSKFMICNQISTKIASKLFFSSKFTSWFWIRSRHFLWILRVSYGLRWNLWSSVLRPCSHGSWQRDRANQVLNKNPPNAFRNSWFSYFFSPISFKILIFFFWITRNSKNFVLGTGSGRMIEFDYQLDVVHSNVEKLKNMFYNLQKELTVSRQNSVKITFFLSEIRSKINYNVFVRKSFQNHVFCPKFNF